MMQLVEVIRCPIMVQSRLPLFPIGPPVSIIKTEQVRLSVGQKVGPGMMKGLPDTLEVTGSPRPSPSYLRTPSDQILEVGMAWQQSH